MKADPQGMLTAALGISGILAIGVLLLALVRRGLVRQQHSDFYRWEKWKRIWGSRPTGIDFALWEQELEQGNKVED